MDRSPRLDTLGTGDDERASTKGFLRRLLPKTGPSWWELALAAVAVAFTVHRFAVSTFYGQLDVSPEEVGVGATSALEGTVFLLVLLLILNGGLAYLYGLMFGRPVLAVRDRIKALRKASQRGLLPTMFVIHRLVVVLSIFAVVAVFGSIDADRQVVVGPWEPELATLVLLGFGAFWVALAWLNKQLFPAAKTTGESDYKAVRRVARYFAIAILVLLTIAFLATPTFLAYRDASAVRDGEAVSRNLYQVTPVILTPMAGAVDVLRDTTSHCLLYLGHADGITVLYDADARATVRLPSSQVMVTDPQDSHDAPAAPCDR